MLVCGTGMAETRPARRHHAVPALRPGEAHVWRIPLDEVPLDAALPILTPQERERAGRFHGPVLQRRYVAAHSALRGLLAAYLDQAPSALAFVEGSYGKPSLSIPSPIRFNLSHSGAVALVALTSSCEIGVDVEELAPVSDADGLAARFFAPAEAKALQALPPEQRSAAFLDMWVQKEAVLKGLGVGLSQPLSDVAASFGRRQHARVAIVRRDGPPAWWHVWDIAIGDAHVAALAAPDRLHHIELHRWNWRVVSK